MTQAREKIGRVMAGVLLDQEGLRGNDLLVLILADLGSDMGRALQEVLSDSSEALDEYQRASAEGRRPVVVEGLKGQRAVEFLRAVLPEALEYAQHRPVGSFVMIVIDKDDDPCSVMVVPTIGAYPEGAVH